MTSISFWKLRLFNYFERLQQLPLHVPAAEQPTHLTPRFFSLYMNLTAAITAAKRIPPTIIFAIFLLLFSITSTLKLV